MTRDDLSRIAAELGFSQVGVAAVGPSETHGALTQWLAEGRHGTMDWMARHADLRADPRNLMPSTRSVVAVALDYNQPRETRPDYPRIARYALGRDYHKVIRGKLKKLAKLIPGENRPCVDSAPILEREWAHRAGLGWFGKNTLLIDSRRGSWSLLGILLTEHEFPPDAPALGGCGSCHACVEACPTGAIVHSGGRWLVDARQCISYWTIESKAPEIPGTHGWTFGCDVCQEVCPFNEPRESQPLRGRPVTEPDLKSRANWPSLKTLRGLSEEDLNALTEGSSTRRASRSKLQRP